MAELTGCCELPPPVRPAVQHTRASSANHIGVRVGRCHHKGRVCPARGAFRGAGATMPTRWKCGFSGLSSVRR